ncbi:MAG: GxxExxY protein [Phycisphaeraceae bacterium]|nr:GxxExxY protein [Phycisphaeraceae bacterium]
MNEKLNKLTEAVIGAAIEVHRVLGPGFLESTYEKALSIELSHRGIRHVCQQPVQLSYKGQAIGEGKLDLLVDDQLVIELKTIEQFAPIHTAQVISYLKATGLGLGLLINFNVTVLKDGIRRVVLSSSVSSASLRFKTDTP